MAKFYVDSISPWKQRLLSLLPLFLPFSAVRKQLILCSSPTDPHDEYLATMRLEVLWLGKRYLKNHFIHSGTEHINPDETYIITSLHYGQWGMYPASLYQQSGIGSQMVISGRNKRPDSPVSYFWKNFGHSKQHLSGHPGRYSTERFFRHTEQLKRGISQIVILDVREQGLKQKEVELFFMGGPFYLPKTVPLLARRAKVKILPYIGFYDTSTGKHEVRWFQPITPKNDDAGTLQKILDCLQPTFQRHPEMYFNILENHRIPWF